VAVIFPLLAFALLFGAWYLRERDWRIAWLISAALWGSYVTLLTEALSLFRAVAVGPLAIAWGLTTAALAVWLALALKRARTTPQPSAHPNTSARGPLDWPLLSIVALLGLMLTTLGFIAVTSAPNTVDALTYHLPRVLHWLQNGHVGHYPTSILRQVYLGPWSSYALLQFQALLDGDQLTGIVQWFSLVTGTIGCSLIARQLGANGMGQVLAATLAGTAPMAVLQGPSSQNDLVVASWMVCAVWLVLSGLDAGASRNRRRFLLGMAGAMLGHAILTKATAYLFGFPFCVWLAVALWRRSRWQGLPLLALFASLALAPNLPTYLRQALTFGSPLGPGQEAADLPLSAVPYGNDVHSPGAVASNLLRNLALELGTPWPTATAAVEQGVAALHRVLGLDPNDPRTTWPNMTFRVFPEGWRNESFAGNPLHLLLLLAAFGVVAFRCPRSNAGAYALAVTAGFVLFSALLRWNIWMSRLLVPLLVLGTPVVGLVLQSCWRRWLAMGTALVAIALATPFVLWSASRPLVGPTAYWRYDRIQQYYFFNNGPAVYQFHQQIVDNAARFPCQSVGLRMGRDEVEYPLWVAFRARGLRPRFEHEGIRNPTAKYHTTIPPFDPDLTITLQVAEHRVSIEPHRPPRQ